MAEPIVAVLPGHGRWSPLPTLLYFCGVPGKPKSLIFKEKRKCRIKLKVLIMPFNSIPSRMPPTFLFRKFLDSTPLRSSFAWKTNKPC